MLSLRHRPLQLSARSINISAARTTHKRRNACLDQQVFECLDALLCRRTELDARPGIERDEIYFAADTAQQFNHFSGVSSGIIHVAEQNVFKRDAFTVAEREVARGLHQHFQVPLFVDRHNAAADLVIGRVERNGQLGTHRLGAKVVDARNNSGSRDRHARFRKAHAFHQQPHGLHEVADS